MPVTAPADRRFLRAQVKPGRRPSPWRARLRAARLVVLTVAILLLLWRGAVLVTHAETLQVAKLPVSGLHQLQADDVQRLLSGLKGQNILSVDLDAWRARLMTCPWISEATLRRSLPSTIEISVVERQPMALGRKGDTLFLVDDHGRVIDTYGPKYAELDLPLLDGLQVGAASPDAADERRVALAASLLRAVEAKPDLARRISQVDVSDPRNAVVIVDKDTARLRLGDTKFVERLQVYLDMAPRMRESVPDIDYVDLRFGERVFVGPQAKPTAGAATASSRQAGAATHQ